MLRMMIIANNLECKLSISEKFDLSLSSFVTVRFNVLFTLSTYDDTNLI